MKFVIDRSKWLRGEGTSRLLRHSDGKMCCIGQVCKQLGVPDDVMRGVPAVQVLPKSARPAILMSGGNTGGITCDWIGIAYVYNDSMSSTDSERQEKLTRLAAENGHELVFVDSSPPATREGAGREGATGEGEAT